MITKPVPVSRSATASLLIYGTISVSFLLLIFTPSFAAHLGFEDGVVEYASAALFFASALVAVRKGLKALLTTKRDVAYVSLLFVLGLLFLLFAGEELSWGQRIFGIKTTDFFQANNWQGEINLHNIQTDISNILYHYGAFIILLVVPFFSVQITQLFDRFRVPVLKSFIGPTSLAIPMLGYIGMIDPRFLFIIEKPWAALFYVFALFAGIGIAALQLFRVHAKHSTFEFRQLLLSLVLILTGIGVSYLQIADTSPNTISEYKELIIALGLFLYTLQLRSTRVR